MIAAFSPERTNWVIGNNRMDTNLLVGIQIGHCKLKRHLSHLRIKKKAMCPECVEAEETSFHRLAQCPINARITFATCGTPEMNERNKKRLKWGEIFSFL